MVINIKQFILIRFSDNVPAILVDFKVNQYFIKFDVLISKSYFENRYIFFVCI